MPICQTALPVAPWEDPALSRLPGMRPLDPADWIVVDDAYAAQMAERQRLLTHRPDACVAALPGSAAAVAETVETVRRALAAHPDFEVTAGGVRRPDGVWVAADPGMGLAGLGRLIQEDLCILEKPEGAAEHVLTAALLTFPSNWTLAEKTGRPLTRIHRPVASYDDRIARGVQRLFDAVRPGRPLWRANALVHADPTLFNPRLEAEGKDDARTRPTLEPAAYLRSERQSVLRLPRTGAVVFSIHTYVVPITALTPSQRESLAAHLAR